MRAPRVSAVQVVPRHFSSLAFFSAASIALHAALVAYGPAGLPNAPHTGLAAQRVLHATLARAEASPPILQGESVPRPIQDEASRAAHEVVATAARAGAPDGLNLPVPEKWFTAQELDTRAEPLTSPNLEYPQELTRTGTTGRVQVMLFIDERGIVRKTEVTAAVPEQVFDKAAIKAWSEVRFSPAIRGGVAVKSQKLLEMAFTPF